MVATTLPPSGLPGRGGPRPGQCDQRQTLVASGWQALPLDYRRGIILPFPALPLRVAPEHPGKPPRVSTALGQRQEGHRRGDTGASRGPSRGIQGPVPSRPCCGLGDHGSWAHGAQHSLSRLRSLACTDLLEVGAPRTTATPSGAGCMGTYEMLKPQQEGQHEREGTVSLGLASLSPRAPEVSSLPVTNW